MKLTFFSRFIIWYRRLSILIGVLIPILCYISIPDINILNDPLSRFGIEPTTKFVWILFNQLMVLALFSIGRDAIKLIKNNFHKLILNWLLYPSLIGFSLSGFITMDIKFIHLTLAGIFFLLYVGFIFWYGVFIKNKFITLTSIILVSLCVIGVIPSFLLEISYGTFEVIFISAIITWNHILIQFLKSDENSIVENNI